MTRLFSLFSLLLATCSLLHGATYTQYSTLPTLYINTENSAPITSKEVYLRASMVWVDGTDVKEWDNTLGIRGRGNSTWGLDKKPYRIKFDSKTQLLGSDRAKAKSWTLLANYADKTLLRNAVAAFIGTRAGQTFTAAAQFVDVVLNGRFIGNYQISDQIEVRPKRVDITEQDKTPADGDDITGGYLLEVDGFATGEPVWFSTPRGVKITIKSPDEEVIATSQRQYIQNYIAQFESALFSDNFTDPEQGYRRFIDPSTLASWYIATEMTGNVDGFWSTYIYKERGDDHIYWGPLWDYDIAFNNCNRTGTVTESLMTERGFGDDLTKVWVNRMWEDPWFANLINDTWRRLVADGIEQATLDYIDLMAAHVNDSQRLNFNIWPLNRRVYNEIVLFDTYQAGVNYLKQFVTAHTAYLTRTFQKKVDDIAANTPTPAFDYLPGYTYRIVNKGTHKTVGIDAAGTGLCIHDGNPDDMSQEWTLEPHGNWYSIVNHHTGRAVADAAPRSGTGYTIGTTLALAPVDYDDPAQQWAVTPISTGLSYCLVNRATSLAWNNNGGSSADGTPVISWTNDSQNKNKTTRQWHLNKSMPLDPAGDAGMFEAAMEPDYRVTYNPADMTLHFSCTSDAVTAAGLTGTVSIYSAAGRLLMQAPVAESVSVSRLPHTLVIVTWIIGSRPHSAKLLL